jgi:hypothetical protein
MHVIPVWKLLERFNPNILAVGPMPQPQVTVIVNPNYAARRVGGSDYPHRFPSGLVKLLQVLFFFHASNFSRRGRSVNVYFVRSYTDKNSCRNRLQNGCRGTKLTP